VAGAGTLFIERERRHDTHRVNREVAQALEAGDIVAVFPEGTVTDGKTLLPFKGSLLQPIVDAAGHVQPVAIRYRTPDGAPSTVPAYVEDITFIGSLWRICGEPALVVELTALPPVAARQQHRRGLARQTETAIRAALALPGRGSAPGRGADRESESR
jgi:1-acyl-sn-glycerol-3-phosphate acyltransferase